MTDTTAPAFKWRARCGRSALTWDRLAVISIVVGAAIRIGWILVIHPPVRYVYSDMRGYVLRGAQFASGEPLTAVDAFYPPGTHMLIAGPVGLLGVKHGLWAAAVLWCLLSISTVYVSWKLARLLLSPAGAALTATFCAMWPLFITYGGYFTSETPALAFPMAAMWAGVAAVHREGWIAPTLALMAGVLAGAASAVRPQLVLNALVLVIFVFAVSRRRLATVVALIFGLALVLGLVSAHNTAASGQLAGLARNGGVNFWFGHCEARSVTTTSADNVKTYGITHPVAALAGRSGDFIIKNHDVWDEDLFLRLGRECIERDGWHHALRLGRNLMDMTATTTPWPQSGAAEWERRAAQAANLVYSMALPLIVIGVLFQLRRRQCERVGSGQLFMLANMACVVVVAIVVIGDPRLRAVYDVFGLALLGALLADRFHLDASEDTHSVPAADG